MPLRIPLGPLGGPFYLGKPTESDVEAVLSECQRHPFNFPHAKVTQNAPELTLEMGREGYTVEHHRVQVGKGRTAYRQAQCLLKGWKHFRLGWATTNEPVVQEGAPVVVTAQSLFLWSCNPLRVSFVEEGARRLHLGGGREIKGRRLAFGCTTLRGHQISGEERFSVEWHPHDDTVWFDIYTVSKPATAICALAFPLLRHYQRQFVSQSMAAMQQQMGPKQSPKASKPVAAG